MADSGRADVLRFAYTFRLPDGTQRRFDVRLDAEGVPNVVEVNPLPGILPDPADNSCFPKAARAAGMSYDQLIQSCLVLAAERQGVSLAGEHFASRSAMRGAAARGDVEHPPLAASR